MTVVVDANILIASALSDEPLYPQANQILSLWRGARTPLAAPRLFRSEVTSVLRKAVYQQRITHEVGRLMLRELLSYPVEFHEDDELLTAGYELAMRFNRPRAYDTQYMALAERLDCEFWTTDAPLVNSVQGQFSRIRWLGAFRQTQED